jgi:Fimbrial assembly protein (PilN)
MKTHLNLLPWKCQRGQMIRLRLARWSILWGAAAGALVILGLLAWNRSQASQRQLERLEWEYAPVARLHNEIKTLRGRLEGLDRQEAALALLETPRPALTLLGFVSQSTRECEGRLRVEHLALQTTEEAARTAAKTPVEKAPGPSAVTIRGTAADNQAVARFVMALRETGAFDRVDLKSSEEKTIEERRVCSFSVECAY